jgi:cytosine/adenosine deaminase-related metal-dependent hydrolase
MTTKKKKAYVVEIKTQPLSEWLWPDTWGPYATRIQAEEARARAERIWMRARIVEIEAA